MNIVITGATGMLGRALHNLLQAVHSVHPLSSEDMDIRSLPQVRARISDLKPDWIIHAAAFTRVDEAESNTLEAYRVNGLGTRNIATAAHENGSKLLYYSTDYIFDGRSQRPYREWDPPAPLNEYGRSKLAGEFFIRSLCPAHLIVRTSWLFGPKGRNSPPHFVDKISERAQARKQLRVVNDQRGCPTFAPDLARMTLCLIERGARGVYHATNSGDCSWYDFAREIVRIKGLDVEIAPVSSSELEAPARRPAFSVLDNYVLKLEEIPPLRPWSEALRDYLGVS